jgi:hypothetical protein
MAGLRGWLRRGRAALASPLVWVVLGSGVLYGVGLGWGLPASDTWDNDGVAPRDFLVAVAQTFDKQGFDFAYLHLAPVHLVLLAILTLPVTLAAVIAAHGSAPAALVHEMIQTPYMTAIAWIARLVTVAMALGHVWALGKIAEELRGRRAGLLVAAVAGVNAVLVYYAHTTDLEVPYLFWTSLALLALVRALARREPRRLRAFAVLGALAIGTKDQAAGVFLFGAPLAIALWVWTDAWAREHRGSVLREAFVALGIALGVFLVADEVVVNPTGFLARVHFLLGPASQDHAQYTADLVGRVAVLADVVGNFGEFFPVAMAPFALLGFGSVLVGPREARTAGWVPFLALSSFVVAINLTALRTEHRFLLFPMEMVGLYVGLGFDQLLASVRAPKLSWLARGAVAVLLALALFKAAGVDEVLLHDPRYEAEAFLRDHVVPGDLVETYGINVYSPRFPQTMQVARVGPEPVRGRSPLAGVTDVQDAWDGLSARQPRWIVVSEGWMWHYLEDPAPESSGRILPPAQVKQAQDAAASRYFRALMGGELGYRKVHLCRFTSSLWPRVRIHASTGESIWILEREG